MPLVKYQIREYSHFQASSKASSTKLYIKGFWIQNSITKTELLVMFRQPICTHPTPLTQPAWDAYLDRYFQEVSNREVWG